MVLGIARIILFLVPLRLTIAQMVASFKALQLRVLILPLH
jgi:hypothetical protein